ncbi:MAG: hypothetical protein AAGD23_13620 [Pseudomonadota bacterium]
MAVTERPDGPSPSASEPGTSDKQDPFEPSEAFLKRRRARSVAIALILVAMVVLFYVVTLVKLGPGVMDRPL